MPAPLRTVVQTVVARGAAAHLPNKTSWQPGQSGNPRGRAKSEIDIAALARVHGPKCIETAAALLDDADPRIRLGALVALFRIEAGAGRGRRSKSPTLPTRSSFIYGPPEAVSRQIAAERRGQRPTITGHFARSRQASRPTARSVDLLAQPLPEE